MLILNSSNSGPEQRRKDEIEEPEPKCIIFLRRSMPWCIIYTEYAAESLWDKICALLLPLTWPRQYQAQALSLSPENVLTFYFLVYWWIFTLTKISFRIRKRKRWRNRTRRSSTIGTCWRSTWRRRSWSCSWIITTRRSPPVRSVHPKITVSLLSRNIFGLLDFGTGIKRLLMWRNGSKEDAEPAGIPPTCVQFSGWTA